MFFSYLIKLNLGIESVRNTGKGMACERDLWQERSGMRSGMIHPEGDAVMGSFRGSLPFLCFQKKGLSKWAEMLLLCQPQASGADVRLCAFFSSFFYASTLRGHLGTDRTSQTKHKLNLLFFFSLSSDLKVYQFNFLY